MGAINYTHNIEPTHQLLALAVFVDSLKPAYVRSIHVHEELVGSLYTIQQEFLLNPGEYVRVSAPVMLGSIRTFMLGAGVKQIVDTFIKTHHAEGWHCVLVYRSDSPSETVMPYILTPSRNVDLKSVPSLEQDLKLVENALMSSSRNSHSMLNNDEIITNHRPCGEGKTIHKDDCGWFPSSLTLSCPSSLTLLDHVNDRMPGLETPERTPHGNQVDIWQNWGSELELASPEISLNRTSQSKQGTLNSSSPMSSQNAGYAGALWNPSTLLDLNLELTEFSSQDKDVDCTLVLSSPVSMPTSCLNLQLGMPSLSLQQSTITEDSMDLECFMDSPPNMALDPNITELTKAIVTQSGKSMCSEDSVSCHGCVINMSPWDVNGNSSMTSSGMHSTTLKKCSACMNDDEMFKNSPTSISMYSAAHMENAEYDKVSKGSLATSSDISDLYSVPYKKNAEYSNIDKVFKDSAATSIMSSDIYSAAYEKNVRRLNGDKGSPATSSEHSWRGQGKESSGRASSSSVSTQSVRQGPSKAGTSNKPRIILPGRLPEITWQELSGYFSMPITQASKELKVGLTVLKKRCRQFGIPRWPHRKMKSIHNLISNLQGLAEDQGAKSSPRVKNVVRELEEQKKLIEEMPAVELAERTKKLRQACFKANYKKRKLGMKVSNGPCKPPGPLPPSVSHSFNVLNPSTLIIPSPRNHHTMDHFI